eukprot:TRINITY_DN296_c0_g1_i2.p1 TRINITY_DN296_c0_g1~~TRINITY_DN296_c0_g1_i2.p1  ORF type:complete len:286 (+),score=46.75 TRINITY_DN296_c0_g1_i2:37-858(+)
MRAPINKKIRISIENFRNYTAKFGQNSLIRKKTLKKSQFLPNKTKKNSIKIRQFHSKNDRISPPKSQKKTQKNTKMALAVSLFYNYFPFSDPSAEKNKFLALIASLESHENASFSCEKNAEISTKRCAENSSAENSENCGENLENFSENGENFSENGENCGENGGKMAFSGRIRIAKEGISGAFGGEKGNVEALISAAKTSFGWAKSVDFKTRIVPHSTKCRENGGKCTCIGELFPDVPADRVRRIYFYLFIMVFISVLRARCFFFPRLFVEK